MKKFSQDDLTYIMNLLHRDYHNDNIYIFYTPLQFILYMMFKSKIKDTHYKIKYMVEVLSKTKSLGTYTNGVEEVHIFNYNICKFQKDNEEWCLAQTLFHELRHYWQDKNGKFDDEDSEKDAIKFHLRMINKPEISSELNNYFYG